MWEKGKFCCVLLFKETHPYWFPPDRLGSAKKAENELKTFHVKVCVKLNSHFISWDGRVVFFPLTAEERTGHFGSWTLSSVDRGALTWPLQTSPSPSPLPFWVHAAGGHSHLSRLASAVSQQQPFSTFTLLNDLNKAEEEANERYLQNKTGFSLALQLISDLKRNTLLSYWLRRANMTRGMHLWSNSPQGFRSNNPHARVCVKSGAAIHLFWN